MRGSLVSRGAARVTAIEYIDNGDRRPVWLSSDGTIVYGAGPQLSISRDDGTTWAQTNFVSATSLPGSSGVHGVRETADGEILVSAFKGQGSYAGLWRSTGWQAYLSSATAPTWTEVLSPQGQLPLIANPATFPSPAGTVGDRSNYFTAWFGFHCYGNGYVVVNEYGHQCNGIDTPGSRNTFFSADNGKPGTWVLARDAFSGPPYTTPGNTLQFGSSAHHDHLHGSIYDPFTGRFWTTGGDNGHRTEYSDLVPPTDPLNASGGWTVTPPSHTIYGGLNDQPGSVQAASPWALPDRVLIGTDAPLDGLISYEKPGVSTLLAAYGVALPHSTALQYISSTPFQRDILSFAPGYQPQYPMLMPFYPGSSEALPSLIVACDPRGRRFYTIYTDNLVLANPYGLLHAIGPTARGKLLASLRVDGRSASQTSLANFTFMRADFPPII